MKSRFELDVPEDLEGLRFWVRWDTRFKDKRYVLESRFEYGGKLYGLAARLRGTSSIAFAAAKLAESASNTIDVVRQLADGKEPSDYPHPLFHETDTESWADLGWGDPL